MLAREQEDTTPEQASVPVPSAAQVIQLPVAQVHTEQDEVGIDPSLAHESIALRMTYTDRHGELHRASLSTTGRLTDLYQCTEGVQQFEAQLVSALKLIGMNVLALQPITAASIELL